LAWDYAGLPATVDGFFRNLCRPWMSTFKPNSVVTTVPATFDVTFSGASILPR